jgi:hypothetical protein
MTIEITKDYFVRKSDLLECTASDLCKAEDGIIDPKEIYKEGVK